MMTTTGRRWLALCWLLALAVGCARRGGLQIDDPAPVVSLQDFHGKAVTLPQDLKGKVLLVRFWSLDCVYCNKEMLPALEALYQKYKDQGFVPVAIDVGKYDAKDERWKRFESVTYPMLNDERGLVARRFGVIGMPTSFVIDRDGVVRQKVTGEASLEEFERLFTTVLN